MSAQVDSLFATQLYRGRLGGGDLLSEIEIACRALARDDAAGRAWSKAHGYRGYTSYASLNDLTLRDPAFGEMKRALTAHVAAFANAAAMDLAGRRLKLDSLWVNVLRTGGAHSGHIHPHSVISGTLYVIVPPGAGPIRFEDPRLPLMMAAPARRADAPPDARTFVRHTPAAGDLLLWESWLRHEVEPGTGRGERISVSFNYA